MGGLAASSKFVRQMRIWSGMTVGQLVDEMRACGVLGAGRLGEAADIVAEMFRDEECQVILTLAGALVPGGLRAVISHLVDRGFINVIVTTGANMVHDMIESLGFHHLRGTFRADDEALRRSGIGRIGDIYVELRVYEELERWLKSVLEEIPPEERGALPVARIMEEAGKRIKDEKSILAAASRRGAPIICPGFLDSVVGFQFWTYARDLGIKLDFLKDMDMLMDRIFEAKRLGLIILGGGMPKHFAMFATTFKEGVDLAVQITMDRPEPGGLSGAPLEEAISWSKVKPNARAVTVICDATIAFPIIAAAALEKLPH